MKTKINQKVIKFFDTLADETRLNILVTISKEPVVVNDIHKALGKDNLTLSAISHQLRMMTDLGIVVPEKKGREKYFRLSNDFCWCILNDAFDHFSGKTRCQRCAGIEKSHGLLR